MRNVGSLLLLSPLFSLLMTMGDYDGLYGWETKSFVLSKPVGTGSIAYGKLALRFTLYMPITRTPT